MMADYKQMYLKLLNAAENAMETRIAAQRQCEEPYIQTEEQTTAKRHKDRAAERRPYQAVEKAFGSFDSLK